MINNRNLKSISKFVLKSFGIDNLEDNLVVKDLKELRKTGPKGIVIATPTKSFYANTDRSSLILLKKKIPYVMSLAMFYQLQYFPKDVIHPAAKRKKALKPAAIKFVKVYKPYTGQKLHNKKILVWRTGGIGDLLFIQPNLRKLKQLYPTCHIIFACGKQYQSMVNTWDCIDELIDLPFPSQKLLDCDYHVIFEGVIERCKEAQELNAYKLFSKWLNIEIKDEDLIPIQTTKKDIDDYVLNILKDDFKIEPKNYVTLSIRTSSIVRTPDPKIMLNIINQLLNKGQNVIITDSINYSQLVEDLINKNFSDKPVFNFSKYSDSLDKTISLIKFSKLVVSPDTSLLHLAASVNVPCFGIYGPFPGKLRLETYPKADWVDSTLSCAPCFLHGSKSCKNNLNGYSKCFYNLDSNEINLKLDKLLEY